MWIIVNFTQENSVEVVPEKWLVNNSKCYWPPYRGPKLKSAIADMYKVEDDWDMHPIRIINKNKLYDDLVKARNACRKAQYTSDCSEFENNTKRISKKKVISSSSEEEASDEGLKKRLPQVPEGFSEKDTRKKSHGNKDNAPGTSILTPQQHDSFNNKEFEMQVLRKLSTLSIKLEQVGADVTHMMGILVAKSRERLLPDEEFIYQFPIDSVESFEKFESFIKDGKEYEKFVAYLEKSGGYTTYECVKRIYSRTLLNEFACTFNWHGLKGKKPIKDSLFVKATIEAIMKNKNLSSTEKNIEMDIKSWLRHSKDRLVKKGAPGETGQEHGIGLGNK